MKRALMFATARVLGRTYSFSKVPNMNQAGNISMQEQGL